MIATSTGRKFAFSARARAAAFVLVALVGAFAFVTAVGNGAVVASERAAAAGDPAEAEAKARKATRWAPWSSEAWLLLGRAQVKLGRRADARASFEKGIAEDPADWRLWYELAFASTGPDRQAAFEEAARLNPRGPALAALGRG